MGKLQTIILPQPTALQMQHHIDRKFWDLAHQNPLTSEDPAFSPWCFSDRAVDIGGNKVLIHSNIVFPLAWFDLFCTAELWSESATSTPLHPLQKYYLLLRHAIAREIEATPAGQILSKCPSCMDPWLWRTALGNLDHSNIDDPDLSCDLPAEMVYNDPFPVTCEFRTTQYLQLLPMSSVGWAENVSSNSWTRWKVIRDPSVMAICFQRSQSAFQLPGASGWFRSWQLDVFRDFDKCCVNKPSGR